MICYNIVKYKVEWWEDPAIYPYMSYVFKTGVLFSVRVHCCVLFLTLRITVGMKNINPRPAGGEGGG